MSDTLGRTYTSADDRKLVDGIIYLSSLVSESRAIDPMLDGLRNVTSDWDSMTPLPHKKRLALQKLTIDLKNYLIHQDPLRNFTSAMLDERLSANLAGKSAKTTSFLTLLTGCIGVAALITLLPLPLSFADRTYLSVTMLLLALISVTVWLYLSSLQGFKSELRAVFVYVCISAGFLGLTCLHYTLIGILNLTNEPLFQYGGATEIALIAIASLYLGLVRYANILKAPITSLSWLLLGSIILSLGVTVMTAYLRGVPDKFFFSLSLFSITATGCFAVFGQQMSQLLLKRITPAYASSLKIISYFQIGVALTALCFIIALIWLTKLSVGDLSLLIAGAGIPTMALFMYSGYSFKKETSK